MTQSDFNEKLKFFKSVLGKFMPNKKRVFDEWQDIFERENGTVVNYKGESTYIPSYEAFYIIECAYCARKYFSVETEIFGADDLGEMEYVIK